MDFIVIEGVPPYNGRHEFDLAGQEFTTREWGWIKRLADYMPMTVDEGFRGGDPELFCAFAVIALYRGGRVQAADVRAAFDRLSDSPFVATIRLESDTADEDMEELAEDPTGSSPENRQSSGNGSTTSSGSLDETRPPTGTPDLASLVSPPPKLPT